MKCFMCGNIVDKSIKIEFNWHDAHVCEECYYKLDRLWDDNEEEEER